MNPFADLLPDRPRYVAPAPIVDPVLSEAGKRGAEKRHDRTYPEVPNPWGLTPAQCAVMARIAVGLSAKEIGRALGTAERTVETHAQAAQRRMRAPNGVMAAVLWDRFMRGNEVA